MILKGIIELLPITVLINSRLNRNYIKKSFLNKISITTSPKKQLYRLEIINGININIERQITEEVFLKINLKGYSERITLNIIE